MRKFSAVIVCLTGLCLAGAVATAQDASVSVADQLSLDGNVIVSNVVSPAAGFIAIHADADGLPGPVIGIAPVSEGTSDSIIVAIDVGGATPVLHAVLHNDDNTIGAFEFERIAGADLPVISGDAMVMGSFGLTALRAYDQQLTANAVNIAAVVSPDGGWLAIHGDNNGEMGPVVGQTQVAPGTTAGVVVPLTGSLTGSTFYSVLHVDDTTIGTYDFGTTEGADAPVTINDQMAAFLVNISETPVIVNSAGIPLATLDLLPAILASTQALDGVGTDAMSMTNLVIDSVISVGAGWVDVHANAINNPGPSLGLAPVADGENTNVQVMLDPQMMNPNTIAPVVITPIVWPMLHVDDNQPGVYEYMMIVGADLPVVVNGAVVTQPTVIGDLEGMGMLGEATAEATQQP
jgi:hypothetical protein